MSNRLSKEDIADLDIIDANELLSDGSSSFAYRSGVTVISVISATRTIKSPIDLIGQFLNRRDEPVEPGDTVVISGNAAAGSYTIESIPTDTTIVVVEAIADAISGSLELRHPTGSKKVGVDPANIIGTNATNLQKALEDVSLSSGFSEDILLIDDIIGDVIVDDISGHIMRNA